MPYTLGVYQTVEKSTKINKLTHTTRPFERMFATNYLGE